MSFSEYSKIQSEYANVEMSDKYKEELNKIRPLRPPTAPAQDIQKVRQEILDPHPSILFLQIALFLVFLSMMGYVIMPSSYAHMLAFLLLCVGISLGFFLMK